MRSEVRELENEIEKLSENIRTLLREFRRLKAISSELEGIKDKIAKTQLQCGNMLKTIGIILELMEADQSYGLTRDSETR